MKTSVKTLAAAMLAVTSVVIASQPASASPIVHIAPHVAGWAGGKVGEYYGRQSYPTYAPTYHAGKVVGRGFSGYTSGYSGGTSFTAGGQFTYRPMYYGSALPAGSPSGNSIVGRGYAPNSGTNFTSGGGASASGGGGGGGIPVIRVYDSGRLRAN